MQDSFKRLFVALLTVAVSVPLWAGEGNPAEGSTATPSSSSLTSVTTKADGDAALSPALLGLLVMKGVLTSAEANTLRGVPASSGVPQLLNLLKEKGVVSEADLAALKTSSPAVPVQPVVMGAVATPDPVPQTAPKEAAPAVIPAVAPTRVLPIDAPKQGGIIPDIQLGSGAKMKLYGFFKSTAVEESSSSGGATFGSQDWPLPLLLGDTGPTADPQFHLKARSFRIGSNFEWVPKGSPVTVTAKIEADYEGDYVNANNRNTSSDRSNQMSLRLAWMRLDTKLGELPWFAEFGQDWSILGTSTLPTLFETTGLGVGMGSLYERMPQFKTGVQFHSGDFKVQPEFAIVMPIAGSSALTDEQRSRFGDRAGAESNQPGVEARLVFQFPLSHKWKGVAPAQLIFSGHHARMNEIIPRGAQAPTSVICAATPCTISEGGTTGLFYNPSVPNVGFSRTTVLNATNCATASCTLAELFPHGIEVGNPQNIWTVELQLPTPWVTFAGKYYHGNDLRFFFGGQLQDVFSNLHGLVSAGSGTSFSGRSISFGCAGGTTVGQPANTVNCRGSEVLPAILEPVTGQGGFAELSFPLSRIAHANPDGYNSGWVLHLGYGTDRAIARDARAASGLARTDLDTASLTYKLNKWVTFVNEFSYIQTTAAKNFSKLYRGVDVTKAHNLREEFGPVFTF
jgi:hypothetical protein